jgi:hypothetical protein
MLLSRSRISRFAVFLSFIIFLAPLSPAALNVPPAQAPQTPLALTSQQQDQLHDVVARVLQHADKAGCKKSACTILVANFAGSSGSTSILGMQLADAVSAQLVALSKGIQVVDRHRLQSYLEKRAHPLKVPRRAPCGALARHGKFRQCRSRRLLAGCTVRNSSAPSVARCSRIGKENGWEDGFHRGCYFRELERRSRSR